jgi:hypothetical protein
MADIKAQREGQAVPPPETTEPAPKPVKRSWRLARAKPDLIALLKLTRRQAQVSQDEGRLRREDAHK